MQTFAERASELLDAWLGNLDGWYASALDSVQALTSTDLTQITAGGLAAIGTGTLAAAVAALLFFKKFSGWIINIAVLVLGFEIARRFMSGG